MFSYGRGRGQRFPVVVGWGASREEVTRLKAARAGAIRRREGHRKFRAVVGLNTLTHAHTFRL